MNKSNFIERLGLTGCHACFLQVPWGVWIDFGHTYYIAQPLFSVKILLASFFSLHGNFFDKKLQQQLPLRHEVSKDQLFKGEEPFSYKSPFESKNLCMTMTCFIYILDSSNSSSFTFWTNQFTYSSRCNGTSISTGNSNGSWNDKHSSHFSTAKEISVKVTFFFM